MMEKKTNEEAAAAAARLLKRLVPRKCVLAVVTTPEALYCFVNSNDAQFSILTATQIRRKVSEQSRSRMSVGKSTKS